MTIEVKVPVLPESVADATVVTWHKKAGDWVERDENLVDIETDKVMLEVPAPNNGVLQEIIEQEGTTVIAEQLLARLDETATAGAASSSAAVAAAPSTESQAVPAAAMTQNSTSANVELGPAARRAAGQHDVNTAQIAGTGIGGRVTKQDVVNFAEQGVGGKASVTANVIGDIATGPRPEQRVPMTRLRARVAERLVQAQQEAAMLTTFNEINLQPVKEIRARYKDKFEKVHGARLGFMSFFIKASIEALRRFPAVNSSIDGSDIVYHGYYDVGVAVSTERGLVVPVLRDTDRMSMAEIEASIADYAGRARKNKITIEEMTGGTFTITNGGVFGSLLSTPILNPPQVAILGMHKIEDRAVVENGEIVIRPMMYVALSYDHRIIDGKESVSFLATIKDLLEDPARLLLEI